MLAIILVGLCELFVMDLLLPEFDGGDFVGCPLEGEVVFEFDALGLEVVEGELAHLESLDGLVVLVHELVVLALVVELELVDHVLVVLALGGLLQVGQLGGEHLDFEAEAFLSVFYLDSLTVLDEVVGRGLLEAGLALAGLR